MKFEGDKVRAHVRPPRRRPATDPGIKFSDPGIKFSGPDIKFSGPGIKFSDPGIKFSDPGIKFSDPGIKFPGPGIKFLLAVHAKQAAQATVRRIFMAAGPREGRLQSPQ